MKLPIIKKILREDVKEAPSYINGIIDPINSFMEAVYQSLNRNITLQENIASFVKELNYRTTTIYPGAMENIEFQNQLKSKPIGVFALQVYDKDTYEPPASAVYVPWVEINNAIVIHPITGLDPDKLYLVRLVVF